MMTEKKRNRERSQTTYMMTCRDCGGRMMIVSCGVICPAGCGKIRAVAEIDRLRAAWPERVSSSPADDLCTG